MDERPKDEGNLEMVALMWSFALALFVIMVVILW